jgi:hypothetical protein
MIVAKYRLEVIWDHLVSDYVYPRVRVVEKFNDYDDDDTFAILLDNFGQVLLPAIESWCVENNCGYKVERDMFKFHSEEELTMFMLRWA